MFSSVLRIWDSGTQEKHVQVGCQSLLVLHSLSLKNLGWWYGGKQEKHVQVGCLVQGFDPKNVEL